MKFTIKRSEWDRGKKFGENVTLLTTKKEVPNNKCCLGFFSLSCGIPEEFIKDRNDLFALKHKLTGAIESDLPEEFLDVAIHEEAYIRINDNAEMKDEVREEKLTVMFAEDGIEVEFVD